MPITEEQVHAAKKLSKEIWEDKHEGNFKDKACADTHEIGVTGYLGEIIYADFYNLDRPRLLKGRVDEGHDFIVGGYKVQVKTTTHQKFPLYLILFPEHAKSQVDIDYYALMRINLEEMKADIVTEVTRKEFKQNCFKKDFGYGTRYCYCINESDL